MRYGHAFLISMFLLAVVTPLVRGEMVKGGFILINNNFAYEGRERAPVLFPHEGHMEAGIDCLECHHRYEKKVNTLDIEELSPGNKSVYCSSCHSNGSRSRYSLEEAYHTMCIGCHERGIGQKKGPRLCGHCHARKRKDQ